MLDRHIDLYTVSCIYLLSRKKTVEIRFLRYGSDICGKNDMHQSEILHSERAFFSYILFCRCYLKFIVEKILRVAAFYHYIRRNRIIRIESSQLPSVAAISEFSFSFFHNKDLSLKLHCLPVEIIRI